MPDKNRRKVSFIPRYSIYTPKKNIIFKILENFDFSSIKNIIVIKFKSSTTKAVARFLTRSKNNKLKLINQEANASITDFAKVKKNILPFTHSLKATISFWLSGKVVLLKFNNLTNSIVKLFSRGHENISFNSKSNEHLVLHSKSTIKLRLNNIANGVLRVFLKNENNIGLKNNQIKAYMTTLCKTNEDNDIILKNTSNSNLVAFASTYKNYVGFKTMSNAIVYKPNKLSAFYNLTLEEISDKKLVDLYGIELL